MNHKQEEEKSSTTPNKEVLFGADEFLPLLILTINSLATTTTISEEEEEEEEEIGQQMDILNSLNASLTYLHTFLPPSSLISGGIFYYSLKFFDINNALNRGWIYNHKFEFSSSISNESRRGRKWKKKRE